MKKMEMGICHCIANTYMYLNNDDDDDGISISILQVKWRGIGQHWVYYFIPIYPSTINLVQTVWQRIKCTNKNVGRFGLLCCSDYRDCSPARWEDAQRVQSAVRFLVRFFLSSTTNDFISALGFSLIWLLRFTLLVFFNLVLLACNVVL